MEILPLNYDRYFKKIFSDTEISKQFLEDFLDIEIAEITLLDKDFNVTNTSRELRFDFRCKDANQHFIVEMQQWHKYDMVKRFFLYHCSNTVLQLEKMPQVKRTVFDYKTGKYVEKKIKDYSTLTPAITILWFVDESFFDDEAYIAFSILPDELKNFVKNESLWENLLDNKIGDVKKLYYERKKLAEWLAKKEKNLDFLQENKMIYAFQPQVIKNSPDSRYYRWFDFAEKSKNKENKKTDFTDYEDDAVFSKLLRLLSVSFVPEPELHEAEQFCKNNKIYVDQQNLFYERARDEYRREYKEKLESKERVIKIREEKLNKKMEEKEQELEEKDQKLEEKDQKLEQNKQALLSSAKMMKSLGASNKQIRKVTGFSDQEIEKLDSPSKIG